VVRNAEVVQGLLKHFHEIFKNVMARHLERLATFSISREQSVMCIVVYIFVY
jgi:hypothetical protein